MTSVARPGRRGFSLVEIAVVLIILGVLLGIAYVGWGWFIADSHKNQASATMDRVAAIEQGLARDWGSYTSWPADLADLGNDVTVLNNAPSTGPSQVSLAVGSGGSLGIAIKSADGTCFYRTLASLATQGGGAANVPIGMPTNSACSGAVALNPTGDPTGETALTQTQTIKSSAS